MNYDTYFEEALGRLKTERRYRVFADLERIAGPLSRTQSGILPRARGM